MKILGIHIDNESCVCCFTDTDATAIGCECVFLKDGVILPTLLIETREGEYLINPSLGKTRMVKQVWKYLVIPIGSLSSEQKQALFMFVNLILKQALSNITGNCSIYLHFPGTNWSDCEINEMEDFIKKNRDGHFVMIVRTRDALSSLCFHSLKRIRKQLFQNLIIDYTDSCVNSILCDEGALCREKSYPVGSNNIDSLILNCLINSNEKSKIALDILINHLGKDKSINMLLREIEKWRKYGFLGESDKINLPIVHLRDVTLDRSLTGYYMECEDSFGGIDDDKLKKIIVPYIIQLLSVFRDFNQYSFLDIRKTLNICQSGNSNHLKFFFKRLLNLHIMFRMLKHILKIYIIQYCAMQKVLFYMVCSPIVLC